MLEPISGNVDDENVNALDNKIIEKTASYVTWQCTTFKNPSTLDSQTSAVILEIEGDTHSVLDIQLNGKNVTLSIGDLLDGSRGTHFHDFHSEAFLVHRAVPETQYHLKGEWSDTEREASCDAYDVEVRQTNGQYAWLSPIFITS
jgi:DNA-binding transcriptional regulator LsrR (DeoR family)